MTTIVPDPVERLKRDVRAAALDLSDREARYLVDAYYTIQGYRIEAQNTVRALTASDEPNAVVGWLFDQQSVLEGEIRKVLSDFSTRDAAGQWARSILGIGPVIAAGLLAHIDITRAPTVGHIWRFAGLDPTVQWLGAKGSREVVTAAFDAEQTDVDAIRWLSRALSVHPTALFAKAGLPTPTYERTLDALSDAYEEHGVESLLDERPFQIGAAIEHVIEKLDADPNDVYAAVYDGAKIDRAALAKNLARRPWNADLKVLCWKIGESFTKVSGRPCFPGAVLDEIPESSERAETPETPDSRKRVNPPKCADGCANYGHIYLHRKAQEIDRNESGQFSDQAAKTLDRKRIGKTTDAYKAYSKGRLPDARIHLRAQRYAVKRFLAHFHHVLHESRLGTPPPTPYVIEHLGHVDYVGPPNWPMS